jgi:hypothetical protein
MTALSRRSFLLGTAAAIAAPALPGLLDSSKPIVVGIDLAGAPDRAVIIGVTRTFHPLLSPPLTEISAAAAADFVGLAGPHRLSDVFVNGMRVTGLEMQQ